MRGYRAEEWNEKMIKKCFALPIRSDFYFKLATRSPEFHDTVVSVSLPMYLTDASYPAPDHKDKLSTLAGSFKRLGAEVHSCKFKRMKKIIAYCRKYIHPQFKTFTADQILDTASWINNINHPESRKEQLREAERILNEEGLIPNNTSEVDDPREAASFIKDEKYPEEKPSRWINASSDLIKVAFGPIADKCMEMLVENNAMIKTTPVSERAKAIWHDVGGEDVIVQSSDATAMEDHYANIPSKGAPIGLSTTLNDPRYRISNELMLYMCGAHLTPLPLLRAVKIIFFKTPGFDQKDPVLLRRLWTRIEDAETLKSFFENIMDTYRNLKMRNFGYVLVNAILCSGEMNTSFKNTASMYSMVNYAAFHLSGGKHRFCATKNEGDDSLAAYPHGCAPTEQWWKDHGWVVKIEFVGKANEASFCGLVFAPEALHSVPDIRGVLSKFWTGRKYVGASTKLLTQLLRAKALSIACEYNNVPILGALAQRILFHTKNITIRKSYLYNLDLYERNRFLEVLKQQPWKKRAGGAYADSSASMPLAKYSSGDTAAARGYNQ